VKAEINERSQEKDRRKNRRWGGGKFRTEKPHNSKKAGRKGTSLQNKVANEAKKKKTKLREEKGKTDQ